MSFWNKFFGKAVLTADGADEDSQAPHDEGQMPVAEPPAAEPEEAPAPMAEPPAAEPAPAPAPDEVVVPEEESVAPGGGDTPAM